MNNKKKGTLAKIERPGDNHLIKLAVVHVRSTSWTELKLELNSAKTWLTIGSKLDVRAYKLERLITYIYIDNVT